MTEEDARRIAAEANETWEQAGEMMWPKYLSEAVLTLLERDEAATKENLEAHLYTRCESDGVSSIERAAMHGAIKALNGKRPSQF